MTNYLSAHDTNASLSIDKYYDEEGEETTENANLVGGAGEIQKPLTITIKAKRDMTFVPCQVALTPFGTSTCGTRFG